MPILPSPLLPFLPPALSPVSMFSLALFFPLLLLLALFLWVYLPSWAWPFHSRAQTAPPLPTSSRTSALHPPPPLRGRGRGATRTAPARAAALFSLRRAKSLGPILPRFQRDVPQAVPHISEPATPGLGPIQSGDVPLVDLSASWGSLSSVSSGSRRPSTSQSHDTHETAPLIDVSHQTELVDVSVPPSPAAWALAHPGSVLQPAPVSPSFATRASMGDLEMQPLPVPPPAATNATKPTIEAMNTATSTPRTPPPPLRPRSASPVIAGPSPTIDDLNFDTPTIESMNTPLLLPAEARPTSPSRVYLPSPPLSPSQPVPRTSVYAQRTLAASMDEQVTVADRVFSVSPERTAAPEPHVEVIDTDLSARPASPPSATTGYPFPAPVPPLHLTVRPSAGDFSANAPADLEAHEEEPEEQEDELPSARAIDAVVGGMHAHAALEEEERVVTAPAYPFPAPHLATREEQEGEYDLEAQPEELDEEALEHDLPSAHAIDAVVGAMHADAAPTYAADAALEPVGSQPPDAPAYSSDRLATLLFPPAADEAEPADADSDSEVPADEESEHAWDAPVGALPLDLELETGLRHAPAARLFPLSADDVADDEYADDDSEHPWSGEVPPLGEMLERFAVPSVPRGFPVPLEVVLASLGLATPPKPVDVPEPEDQVDEAGQDLIRWDDGDGDDAPHDLDDHNDEINDHAHTHDYMNDDDYTEDVEADDPDELPLPDMPVFDAERDRSREVLADDPDELALPAMPLPPPLLFVPSEDGAHAESDADSEAQDAEQTESESEHEEDEPEYKHALRLSTSLPTDHLHPLAAHEKEQDLASPFSASASSASASPSSAVVLLPTLRHRRPPKDAEKENMPPSDAADTDDADGDLGRPAWSRRADHAPPLGLPSSTLAIPGAFPASSPKTVSAELEPRAKSTARRRSPLDAALAMQLRPGMGVGADGAWLVRFLMSFFGWFAVLVAGGREFNEL